MSYDLMQTLGFSFIGIMLVGMPLMIIHVTMGFREFFEDFPAIFKRNPQEYMRRKRAEREKHSEHP